MQSDDITMLSFDYKGSENIYTTEVSITSKLDNINDVISSLITFGKKYEISKQVINKLSLALDDMLNNVISYGYRDDKEHIIRVKMEQDSKTLIVVIFDEGVPFNPFERKAINTNLTIEEREIGGLGIHLVK